MILHLSACPFEGGRFAFSIFEGGEMRICVRPADCTDLSASRQPRRDAAIPACAGECAAAVRPAQSPDRTPSRLERLFGHGQTAHAIQETRVFTGILPYAMGRTASMRMLSSVITR